MSAHVITLQSGDNLELSLEEYSTQEQFGANELLFGAN
jgi:hypothetical protein